MPDKGSVGAPHLVDQGVDSREHLPHETVVKVNSGDVPNDYIGDICCFVFEHERSTLTQVLGLGDRGEKRKCTPSHIALGLDSKIHIILPRRGSIGAKAGQRIVSRSHSRDNTSQSIGSNKGS